MRRTRRVKVRFAVRAKPRRAPEGRKRVTEVILPRML